MTKEQFLTVRWNNLISLGLGLIFLTYIVVAFSNPVLLDTAGFIGFVVVGLLF